MASQKCLHSLVKVQPLIHLQCLVYLASLEDRVAMKVHWSRQRLDYQHYLLNLDDYLAFYCLLLGLIHFVVLGATVSFDVLQVV